MRQCLAEIKTEGSWQRRRDGVRRTLHHVTQLGQAYDGSRYSEFRQNYRAESASSAEAKVNNFVTVIFDRFNVCTPFG